MRCRTCQYPLTGLDPRAVHVCPECGAQIEWNPTGRRSRRAVLASVLMASPYAAALIIALGAPRNPYDHTISDGAINLLMLLWLASPLPTVAGLWSMVDRRGAHADRRIAAVLIIGTIGPALLLPLWAFLVLSVFR